MNNGLLCMWCGQLELDKLVTWKEAAGVEMERLSKGARSASIWAASLDDRKMVRVRCVTFAIFLLLLGEAVLVAQPRNVSHTSACMKKGT